MTDEINESDERDMSTWEKLVELAEKEISGEPATYKNVAKALKHFCRTLVYSESFDIALEGVNSTVALKLRSWLDWYVLRQEIETYNLLTIIAKVVNAIQLAFLSIVFALLFLYDSTIPSFVAYDAKIVFSIIGLVIFSAFSFYFSVTLIEIKREVEVAQLFLVSINRTHPNQRER